MDSSRPARFDRRIAVLAAAHIVALSTLVLASTLGPAAQHWAVRAWSSGLVCAQISLVALGGLLSLPGRKVADVCALGSLVLVGAALAISGAKSLLEALVIVALVGLLVLVLAGPAFALRLWGWRIVKELGRGSGPPPSSRFGILDVLGAVTVAAIAANLWRVGSARPSTPLAGFVPTASFPLVLAATLMARRPVVQTINAVSASAILSSLAGGADAAVCAFGVAFSTIAGATLLPVRFWGYRLVRWRGRPPLETE
jgi:hypothetical protein